ncbi:MAG: putative rane protein [Eubacterium sp.]|jgi:MFS family permease|nr:putative rane protein [Eubacterium sp.]
MTSIFSRFKTFDSTSKNAMFFMFEGAVGAIILNLANPFFSMFARRMGANDYEIGLISSLPALVGIMALIPGSILVDRSSSKKKTVAFLILLFGIMYPLAALTPFLDNYKVPLFVTVIALMNWPFSVFNISWQSFFSDVMAARFNTSFTQRTRAATVMGTATSLGAGLLLSYIPKNDAERIIMYQVFFCLSLILAIIQSWFLMKVTAPPVLKSNEEKSNSLSLVKESLKNLVTHKEFRVFVILAFIFHVSWHMGWPLFFIYQVDVVGINEAWLSYVNVAVGFAGVLTYTFWGRVIEKKGARFGLVIGTLGLALNALTIILVKSPYMLLIQSTVTGLTFSAFSLAIFENLIEVVPQKNKTINIALYTTLINISQFLSPMLGVWFYKHTSITFALGFIGAFRLFASILFLFRYIKDRKKMSIPKSSAINT